MTTLERITKSIADKTGSPVDGMRSKSQNKDLVLHRRISIYIGASQGLSSDELASYFNLSRDQTNRSIKAIGKILSSLSKGRSEVKSLITRVTEEL